MDIVIIVATLIAMIIVGRFLIHRLNAQHDARIAAFPYSDALPGVGRRSRKSRRPAGPAGPPGSPLVTTHREHRDGGGV
ncbi:hypothetical protein [Streptomyces sp. 8N706]|uniref:hypothetical protein n=1 Tax=Streptomyces sp. 8N706 TaxID=3457416 RepID=UPI003FD602FE